MGADFQSLMIHQGFLVSGHGAGALEPEAIMLIGKEVGSHRL